MKIIILKPRETDRNSHQVSEDANRTEFTKWLLKLLLTRQLILRKEFLQKIRFHRSNDKTCSWLSTWRKIYSFRVKRSLARVRGAWAIEVMIWGRDLSREARFGDDSLDATYLCLWRKWLSFETVGILISVLHFPEDRCASTKMGRRLLTVEQDTSPIPFYSTSRVVEFVKFVSWC